MTQYLIGYDISEPKRLQKIYRRIIKYATPIQYSLFILVGNEQQLNQCLNDIFQVFNKKEDDLRVYLLPENYQRWDLGKPLFPEGILWCL